jgi:hypothetical protein
VIRILYQIELSSYRTEPNRTEPNGSISFAPYMASNQEIDNTIDFLVKELEQIRKNAKKELKSMLKKQLKK